MKWLTLENEQQLNEIIEWSATTPCVIFKHSTRCSISAMAKGRIDREEAPQDVRFYYLDLITYRDLSNKVAEVFHVRHESPQVLLIKNGECVYEESHNGIQFDEILDQAAH